ncbi:hypothetical protein [Nocardia wallacei]|nr:hypothetical protein [Nocardia wallacei]
MTLRELIDQLEALASEHGDDVEVVKSSSNGVWNLAWVDHRDGCVMLA